MATLSIDSFKKFKMKSARILWQQAQILKKSTGLVGIPVNPNARPELAGLYSRLSSALLRLPETSGYRKAAEAAVNERISLLNASSSDTEFEQKVGMGQMEELITQAEGELELIQVMEDNKVWETLIEDAPQGQWNK